MIFFMNIYFEFCKGVIKFAWKHSTQIFRSFQPNTLKAVVTIKNPKIVAQTRKSEFLQMKTFDLILCAIIVSYIWIYVEFHKAKNEYNWIVNQTFWHILDYFSFYTNCFFRNPNNILETEIFAPPTKPKLMLKKSPAWS